MITPEMIARAGSEHAHQSALFCWAAMNVGNYPPLKWLHAIPNGYFSTSGQKAKSKAEGLRNGVFDIFLPVPIQTQWAKQYAGLYIEMKIEKHRNQKNGGCSDEQLEFMEFAERMGYYCKVCYNWIEARDILRQYLELNV